MGTKGVKCVGGGGGAKYEQELGRGRQEYKTKMESKVDKDLKKKKQEIGAGEIIRKCEKKKNTNF